MTTMNPAENIVYSTQIKNALGDNEPAPRYVKLSDGTALPNKWIVKERRCTPLMGERENQYSYLVFNWVNEISKVRESYDFSDHDYCAIFTKRSAKHDAIEKANELNIRDNIPLAWVN